MVRHTLANPEFKEWSQATFGEKLGCFETPSSTRDPTSNVDCPDIAPLKFSEGRMANRDAMKVDDRLVHPDSDSREKYCLGTGLQMRKGRPSHKLKTCSYHNASLSKQGKFLKTMTQEAMQVRPSSDSEAATMYKLKGKSSNNGTGHGFKQDLILKCSA